MRDINRIRPFIEKIKNYNILDILQKCSESGIVYYMEDDKISKFIDDNKFADDDTLNDEDINTLTVLWEKHPDLRFGQLVGNCLSINGSFADNHTVVYTLEDCYDKLGGDIK